MLLFFQSCKNNRTQDPNEILKDMSKDKDFNSGNLNFKFELPDGWYRIDTTLQGVYFCVLMNNDSLYRPRVNVANESMNGRSQNDYVLGTKNYLVNNMPAIELLDEGNFNVMEKNCSWYSYNRTQDSIKREMIFYSIAIDGISYNITAGLNVGGRSLYKQTIDEIVKSFKLN